MNTLIDWLRCYFPSSGTIPAYLPLGFTFITPKFTMKGMIAFVGVGASFLFLHYNQQQQAKK
jgi:hypothetical protein